MKLSKKKIGVLNFQYSNNNYGAVLQAAALEHILLSFGHDVEHIDYQPLPYIRNLKLLVRRLLVLVRIKKPLRHNLPKVDGTFEQFRKCYLNRSRLIKTPQKFNSLSNKYDLVIVGSDQVWRPKMSVDFAGYLLAYVPDNIERASYAASFGVAEWEEGIKSPKTRLAYEQLKKYKSISCRETSGVEICKRIFDIEATHVLDPLLQVDDGFFEKILADSTPSLSRLVYYKLDDDQVFSTTLNAIQKDMGLEAHNIYLRNGKEWSFEKVSQWVRNIYDSELVISDSFHCICLALRFNKTVIYCPNPSRGQARITDLIEYLKVDVSDFNTDSGYKVLRLTELSQDRLSQLRMKTSEYIESLSN